MSAEEKSIWDDFMVFFGFRSYEPQKHQKTDVGTMRQGYPYDYLDIVSPEEQKAIRRDSRKMQSAIHFQKNTAMKKKMHRKKMRKN